MPSLRERQAAFQAALLAPAAPGAAPGLAVYRNNLRGNLALVLRLAFPATQKLLGDAAFNALAADFCLTHPPRDADLHRYGATFPAFLADSAAQARLPALADLAWLDWSVHRALHAQDAPPLDPASLANAPETLVFLPRPSLSLLTLRRDVRPLWAALLSGDDHPPADDNIEQIALLHGPEGIEMHELDQTAFSLAVMLASAVSLEDAASHAGEDAASALAQCFTLGLFSFWRDAQS